MRLPQKALNVVVFTMFAGLSFSLQAQSLSYTDNEACSGCGMTITAWPGPKAQVLKQGEAAEKFCSVRCMLCNTLERSDIDQLLIRAHNAAKVDWDHPGNGEHIDVKKAWFVVGSRRRATMGESVAPFVSEAEAKIFQATWGGTLMTYDELTRDSLRCPKKHQ